MLNSQTYVVTSPHLASHVQRASSTLLWEPLIIPVTEKMVGFQKSTINSMLDAKAKEENRPPFMDRLHEMAYSVLGPSEIRSVSAIMLDQLSQRINALPNACEINIFQWCRELFADVTTYAFYGPENPFVIDPSLIKDYWEWEYGIISLMALPFPQFTARKSYVARERMFRGFLEYLEHKRQEKASFFVQERIRFHEEANIPLRENARSEVGMLFGAIANGGITTFWVFNNILSRPQLLSQLREEISAKALSMDSSSQTGTISFEALKSSCPLLNSIFKETIRLVAPMTSARLVAKDTIVADTYLLRANSVIQVAGGVIHEDASIWGPDVASFNPRRFIDSPHGTKTGPMESQKKTVHPAAWRGFGGGLVYCPGRHFAQSEIFSLVAVLVLGWEFAPITGEEKIRFDPPKDEKRMPLGVVKPLRDVPVSMKRRKGMENIKWVLKFD